MLNYLIGILCYLSIKSRQAFEFTKYLNIIPEFVSWGHLKRLAQKANNHLYYYFVFLNVKRAIVGKLMSRGQFLMSRLLDWFIINLCHDMIASFILWRSTLNIWCQKTCSVNFDINRSVAVVWPIPKWGHQNWNNKRDVHRGTIGIRKLFQCLPCQDTPLPNLWRRRAFE